jgi:hypothetical protein
MASEAVREAWWVRHWHNVRAVFADRHREHTALELRLLERVQELEVAVADRDRLARQSQLQLDVAESRLTVAKLEIEELTALRERDRRRVEAEAAAYSRRIAEALAPSPQHREDV